jgi:hypothetical protein
VKKRLRDCLKRFFTDDERLVAHDFLVSKQMPLKRYGKLAGAVNA